MLSLVTQIQNFFSEELLAKTSDSLQEKQGVIEKIIKVGIPCVLKGIVNKSQKDDGQSIFNIVKQSANMNMLANANSLNHLLNGNAELVHGHNDWLSLIFGNKKDELVNAVATYSNSKTESSKSILNTLVPVSLTFIGEHSKNNHFTADKLFNWLKSHLGIINGLIPQDVRFSNLLSSATPQKSGPSPQSGSSTKSGSNMLIWILLGVLFIALCWYVMRSCNNDQVKVEPHITVDSLKEVTIPVRESLKVKLVNGVEIEAYKGGIEDILIKCLNNKACEPSKDVWYDFDNLNFKVGSDSLTAESMQQVKNIAEILKAYPNSKIKIGGYADRTGDSAASWKISLKRAETVLNEIMLQGANASQLAGKEGYGWQFAKYPASASENERKTDRRISLQLREK